MVPTINELRKQNELLSADLRDGAHLFTSMVSYVRNANLSQYSQELVIADIGRIFMEAQDIHFDITKIIGEDPREFCDGKIASFPGRTFFQRVAHWGDFFLVSLSTLFLIITLLCKDTYRIVKEFLEGEDINYAVEITIGVLISAVAIMAIVIFIIRVVLNNPLRSEAEYKVIKRSAFIVGGLGFLCYIYLMASFGQISLGPVDLAFLLTAVCGFFVLSRGVARFS